MRSNVSPTLSVASWVMILLKWASPSRAVNTGTISSFWQGRRVPKWYRGCGSIYRKVAGVREWLPFGGVIDSEGILGSLWGVITFYI